MDKLFKKRPISASSRRSVETASLAAASQSSLVKAGIMPDIQTSRITTSITGGEPLLDEDFHYQYDRGRGQKQPPQNRDAGFVGPPRDTPTMSPAFFSDSEDDEAPAPPDFSGKQTRLRIRSSSQNTRHAPSDARDGRDGRDGRDARFLSSSVPTSPDSRPRSSTESRISSDTGASSVHALPALQAKGLPDDAERLQPVLEDDPANFDLVAPPTQELTGVYQMEKRADQLFSSTHLEMIFADSKSLLKFTSFLNTHRPQRIPILIFYLDALKALRAITYANAISEALEPIPGFSFTEQAPEPTENSALLIKAKQAFEVLVKEDLPAYIAHVWIQVVSVSIQKRITGTLAPHLREASEGLAEVFCLTDPSRPDNPIVFASEEFHRTTQYGVGYAIGRNCRFLQGPRTSPDSIRRLRMASKQHQEHSELFVNYRRDGSPFMNLLMIAPLFDSKGTLRYFIGAQVDVSGLLKECTGTDLDAFARLVARDEDPELAAEEDAENQKDEFQNLSEMFNVGELETVRNHGGRMHREQVDDSDLDSIASHRPRLVLKDHGSEGFSQPSMRPNSQGDSSRFNGKLEGVYQNYLLVRPAPSLRILFTSPSLRVPGILQSPFLSRIGGSPRVRADLAQAMSEGRGVTAKIRWLTKIEEDGEGEGRSRWIHATPLYGHQGAVGVWMVVLVDEDSIPGEGRRRFRAAPAVANAIGGKEYRPEATRERRERERTRIDKILPASDGMTAWEAQLATPSSRLRPQQHVANLDKKATASVSSGRGGTGNSELSFQLR